MEIITVTDIVKNHLCCSCGACILACPQNAIQFEETAGGLVHPSIDTSLCTECGFCVKVCPGLRLSETVLEQLPDNPFAGNALTSYLGKASDTKIHTNGQSGGVTTALLKYAFENDIIDSALVVTMEEGAPPRPRPFLATSPDELSQTQKSKYTPVPLLSALKDTPQVGRFAVVGTPCQIHGLKNLVSEFPAKFEGLSFSIGLFCDRMMTSAAIDFLINEAGMNTKEKTLLNFRDKSCGGYPGNVSVTRNDGKTVVLPSAKRMQIKDFFTPPRCRICFDKMNVLCDIAVGDPWGISDYDKSKGETVFIARTEKGENLIRSALTEKCVIACQISYNSILKGQHIDEKKKQWSEFLGAWENKALPLPEYAEKIGSIDPDPRSSTQRMLNHSIELDSFGSREKLLGSAKKELRLKRVTSFLKKPVRIVKKVKIIINKLTKETKE